MYQDETCLCLEKCLYKTLLRIYVVITFLFILIFSDTAFAAPSNIPSMVRSTASVSLPPKLAAPSNIPYVVRPTASISLPPDVTITPVSPASPCVTDVDCQDPIFCNGVERCQPGAPGADIRGCVKSWSLPCFQPNTRCVEETMRCVSTIPNIDADGDGHRKLEAGGDDCDDNDPNRFPGNAEVWDINDHDEDCNPKTHGVPTKSNGGFIFGYPNRVGPIQVCSGEGYVILEGVVGGETTFRQGQCSYGYVCVPQPSGDGICQPRPQQGYTPAPIVPAYGDQH